MDMYHTNEEELIEMGEKGIDNIPFEFYARTGLDPDDMI
jgi:hypothetical protein